MTIHRCLMMKKRNKNGIKTGPKWYKNRIEMEKKWDKTGTKKDENGVIWMKN